MTNAFKLLKKKRLMGPVYSSWAVKRLQKEARDKIKAENLTLFQKPYPHPHCIGAGRYICRLPTNAIKTYGGYCLEYDLYVNADLQMALNDVIVANVRPEMASKFYLSRLAEMFMNDRPWDEDYLRWLRHSQAVMTERRMREEAEECEHV